MAQITTLTTHGLPGGLRTYTAKVVAPTTGPQLRATLTNIGRLAATMLVLCPLSADVQRLQPAVITANAFIIPGTPFEITADVTVN